MAPRSPIPNLCIIQVVKMLLPNDQLTAARMSPRSAGLVRAANRRVKRLIIIRRLRSFQFPSFKTISGIPAHSLASSTSVQLLMLPTAAPGEPFSDYPNTTTTTARLTSWNYLLVEEDQVFDQATIELIVTAVFSAVTELQLAWHSDALGENMAALLERPQWAHQLTSLTVFHCDVSGDDTEPPPPPPPGKLLRRLAAAVNRISSLQCLTMGAETGFPVLPSDLCRMTQLKVLAIYAWEDGGDSPTAEASLRSLERYAADNVNNEEEEEGEDHRLQVHLSGWLPTEQLHSLSPALRRRIVRFDHAELSWNVRGNVPRLCRHFPSLNSISLCVEAAPRPIRALFTALSSLPQLVHLALRISCPTRHITIDAADAMELAEMAGNELGRQQHHHPQIAVQLRSLRALDLEVTSIPASLLPWLILNLPAVMPQLKAIHLKQFYCVRRSAELSEFLEQKASSPSYSADLEYFRSTLPLLHPGVPHERVILGYVEPYPTLEQLLSTSW